MTGRNLTGVADGVFGVRVLARLGLERVGRLLALMMWCAALMFVISSYRSDLIRPADLGSDTSNYAAAGERFLNGQPLYSLSPGDRPAPADNPPLWSVPILSPPPMATLWAGLALTPDWARMLIPWGLGVGAMAVAVSWLVLRAPPMLLPVVALATLWLAVTAWSGNVNALILPIVGLAWWATAPERRSHLQLAVGAALGVAGLVKLGPMMLCAWLLFLDRRLGAIGAIAAGLTLVAATWALGGVDAVWEYVGVIRETSSDPSPLSVPGILLAVGLPLEVADASVLAFALGSFVAMFVLRGRPEWSFALAVIASLLVTTVVRPETLCLMVFALVPWASSRAWPTRSTAWPAGLSVLGVAVFVAATITSVAVGGLGRSALYVENRGSETVIVRVTSADQKATWGYRLDPGDSGHAWAVRSGAATGPMIIFGDRCDARTAVRLPQGPATTVVEGTGVSVVSVDPTDQDRWLPIESACAAEAVGLIEWSIRSSSVESRDVPTSSPGS